MTKAFQSFDEYFVTEPCVSVRSLDLGGIVVSELEESSNDISVGAVGRDAILVSLSGSDHHRVRIADVRREAPTGVDEVALVPQGVALQSSWRVRGRRLRTLSVEFDQSLFWRFVPEVMTSCFADGHLRPANYAQRPDLAGIAILLQREMDGTARRGRLFADSAIRLLALEIAASFWSSASRVTDKPMRQDRRIRRAIDHIEAHFTEDLSMLDLAAASGLSLSALTVQFRRATGTSPYAYVIDRRMRHAEMLLRASDLPIAEVALAAGFADQSHLTRATRARRGTTPRMIRQAD